MTVESGNEPTCIAISRPASGDPGGVSVDSGESPPDISVCLGQVVPWLSVWAQLSAGAGQGLEETFLVPDFGCESHRRPVHADCFLAASGSGSSLSEAQVAQREPALGPLLRWELGPFFPGSVNHTLRKFRLLCCKITAHGHRSFHNCPI